MAHPAITPVHERATGCSTTAPLGHFGDPVREFTIDPKDKSKISLKILHFPLPVG